MNREKRLLEALVQLADTMVTGYDVFDLFYHLVDTAADIFDVDEAGLLIADAKGELRVLAVTSESVRTIELLQVHQRQGPCYDAFRTGTQVTASLSDPEAKRTWPEFVDSARKAGFGSVVGVPMRLRQEVLGALNLFRDEKDELEERDLVAVQALADVATIAILQERAAQDSALLVDQLQGALDSRVLIEQAKGIVHQRLGVGMEEAFSRLRRHARNQNKTLRQVAEEVIVGSLDPDSLPHDGI